MTAIIQRFSLGWIGLVLSLLVGGLASAQTAGNSPSAPDTSGSSSTLQTYLQERRALIQQSHALVAQGATQEQLDAWRQQNAAQFQSLQQLARVIGLQSEMRYLPENLTAHIPANASPTFKAFLATRAILANAHAKIHNQLLQSLPDGATQEQVEAMQQQEGQTFEQQYAGDLQLQAQRAQTLAAEFDSRPMHVPGAPVIPPGATPQLAAFLTARNTLAKERAQFWNQTLSDDPKTRQAATQAWQQQNAQRLQQLSQLGQDLSNSTSKEEGANQ